VVTQQPKCQLQSKYEQRKKTKQTHTHKKQPDDGNFYYLVHNYYNEELRNLYSSPSIIRMIKSRRMRWAGYVAPMGEKNSCGNLVGKPVRKRPLGRPTRRCEDNIKIDLRDRMG
jgi:hypothetical protein